MNRRTFLKTLAGSALALGLDLGSGLGLSPLAPRRLNAQNFPDLVAVKGSDLTVMFDRGLEALGGLGQFIKKGQTVLVKPNMGWAVTPEGAANTNPALLAHIIKNALNLGAKKVYVFDNTCDNWKDAYRVSGLEKAATEAGATVAPANSDGYFQKIDLPGAKTLKSTQFHELFLEADVILNVPVLKHHGGAKMTAAMKNLMGAIYDRHPLHRLGLDETIPELTLHKKPNLHIVDAARVMLSGGPRGRGDSRYLASQMLIVSPDPVATDAACAKILEANGIIVPRYIELAAQMGIGVADLNQLSVQRLSA
ncbi:MAG: DUF362 domain-containing protein [Deltaproteobacteria bacterium]|jgi:uncharacterized protein (DUF362 family)|nr:DUF362 domain-containing protein [Deltaproteobacteria bacterium]